MHKQLSYSIYYLLLFPYHIILYKDRSGIQTTKTIVRQSDIMKVLNTFIVCFTLSVYFRIFKSTKHNTNFHGFNYLYII